MLDLLPGRLVHTELLPRPIDQWLADQPGDFSVAFLPPGSGNYEAMFGSLFHAKHLPAFLHASHQPQTFWDFDERAQSFPEAQSVQALRDMHFRYLILDRQYFDGKGGASWSTVEANLAKSVDLQVVEQLGNYSVVAFK